MKFSVELLKVPSEDDWMITKLMTLNTVGKTSTVLPSEEWKKKLIASEHSPIRTLNFCIKMTIPYYVSVHLVRHKFGIEHFVQSQRNDRQDNYDRTKAPQDAMVSHIIYVNAQELMFMARRRLCMQADPFTRAVMKEIVRQVLKTNPEFKDVLVPMCVYQKGCPEFSACNKPLNIYFK
jgi:Holliday junction resolvase RusA-like endonuclease